MRPLERSRSRSRSSQRSGETLSSRDAERFRECQAWARSLPYTTRNDMIEDGSAEESPGASQPQASQPQAREAGDTEPQASQVPTEVEVDTGVDAEVRREAVLSQAIARWDEAFQAAVAAFVDAVAACGSVEEMMQAWSVASPWRAAIARMGPVMGLIERGAPQ